MTVLAKLKDITMKRSYLLILFLMLSGSLWAQHKFEKPDYKLIQKQTSDKNSTYYYAFLLNRYLEFDTTLKLDEYRALYYGYFYHDINENKTLELRDSVRAYYRKDTLLPADYEKLIGWTQKILSENPFDLENIHTQRIYYLNIGDTISAKRYEHRIRALVRAILSSGDGLKEETAIYVADVPHEYFIMRRVMGVESKSQQLTPGMCDYHELGKNDEGIEGIYFNVEQIFEGYNKMFKDAPITLPDDEDGKK